MDMNLKIVLIAPLCVLLSLFVIGLVMKEPWLSFLSMFIATMYCVGMWLVMPSLMTA